MQSTFLRSLTLKGKVIKMIDEGVVRFLGVFIYVVVVKWLRLNHAISSNLVKKEWLM